MHISPRRLRIAFQDHDPNPPILTTRQLAIRSRILILAEIAMAEFGLHALSMTNLAIGLRIDRGTLRFHFPDLDALLAEILRAHLQALSSAIGALVLTGLTTDEIRAARCNAYLAYTRTPGGSLTPAHLLLARDRHTLPPDELSSIETIHRMLGETIAGPLAQKTLFALDAQDLHTIQVQACLAVLHPTPKQTAEPRPAPAPIPRQTPHAAQSPLLLWQPSIPPDLTSRGHPLLPAHLTPPAFQLLSIPP